MPAASRTVTTGAYPLPRRNTSAPPSETGSLTVSTCSLVAVPGPSEVVVYAVKPRGAPNWEPRTSSSKRTSNRSIRTENGGTVRGLTRAPPEKVW